MSTADHPPAVSCAEETGPALCPADSVGAQQDTPSAPQDTPGRPEDTPSRFEDTEEDTVQQNRPGRDHVETAALLAVISVLIVASGWSAIALHGLAMAAGITSWLAWGAPVIVDGPLVQAAIALVVLKRRAEAGADIEPGQRKFFWWIFAMSELVSLIGNGAHAWMSHERTIAGWAAAIIAGVAPLAAMAVMHGLMILIEVLGKAIKNTVPMAITERTTLAADSAPVSSAVSSGHTPVSSGVSSRAAGHTQDTAAVSSPVSRTHPEDTPACPEDTEKAVEDRDSAIWALHLAGKSVREIAAETRLSYGYVGKLVKRLKAEHGVGDGDPVTDDGAGVVLQFVR